MTFSCRPLELKDAPQMLEWMHDENVTEHLGTNFTSKTIDDAEQFITRASQEGKNIHFACVNEKDEYLGTVSLKNVDMENGNAEYAICFRRAAHGTGAASFATSFIIRYAFEVLNISKVYLYLYDVNARAKRFYEKNGFVFEGRQRSQTMHRGQRVDLLWYGITKEEWSL